MSRQWLRKASLVVAAGEDGIELGSLRFTFKIKQYDLQTPASIAIRIYNLSDDTANRIQKEFTRVILQAGYEGGEYGAIFDGTIVQVRKGRENATDTYVDITGAEGDEALNFAVVATSLQAGTSFKDRVAALQKAMEARGVTTGYQVDLPENKLPRGRVLYGMARDHLRDVAFTTGTTFSIQRGQLQIVPVQGYLPGEAVVLNANTGMVGMPEQTQDGIKVRCLLNPMIKVAGRIQIDNASIQQAALNIGVSGAVQNGFIPSIVDDGFYRVVVCEHEGDSRGVAWYSNLICVGATENVTPSLSAKGYT
jgi:hypothetical protein